VRKTTGTLALPILLASCASYYGPYHPNTSAEPLEKETNIGKSKRKQLTTEAKRDKGSKKDEKTAPKRKGSRNPRGANQHGN
jgi:hypothetical protein